MPPSPASPASDARQARGVALRAARKAASLSARKLVERVNDRTRGSDLTEHAVYAYESGRVLLSREVAERLVEVLKVPLGALLVGDPDFRPDADPAGADTAADPDAPPDAGRWAATRGSLLARFDDARPAAEVLARQLAHRRFQLPDVGIFAASFELLDADLAALVQSPEAAWLSCRDDDAWHAPLHALAAAAASLREASADAWADLQAATARPGGAAAACPAAVERLTAPLNALIDAGGRVRKLAAGTD